MNVKIGDKIKELRRRDGRRQEDLADALGITCQAVSRWESGGSYPDLELIPSIANYFGITIDELFGYENDRERKIDAVSDKINEMNRRNNGADVCMDECISVAREALIEFPGNEKITLALASSLYNAGYVRYGEHHIDGEDGYSHYDAERHRKYSEWQEAIKLYEKLLFSLNGGEMRQKAVTELSQLYKNLGYHDRAMKLAESAPDIVASKAFLKINAYDGREAVAACGEALLETVRYSAELIENIVWTDNNIPPHTAAVLLNNAAYMFDLVCTDGFYGRHSGFLACLNMLRSYYLWLANERDEAFEALFKALERAKELDALYENKTENYSSPLLHYVKTNVESVREESSFAPELPEVWPWWSVSEYDKVKSEMQADPRWDEWVRRTRE